MIGAQRRIVAVHSAWGNNLARDKRLLESLERSQDWRHGEVDRLLDILEMMPERAKAA